jgi:hypothetical protein
MTMVAQRADHKGAVMHRRSENWSCLLSLVVAACSAGGDVAPQRFSSASAAGSGGASSSTSTDPGSAGSVAPLGNNATDNPTMLVMTSSAGGAAGASAGAGGSADPSMRKSGMFCQNNVPDSTDCGHINIDTNTTVIQKPGNVLVVFDRSTSMQQDWNGKPKYEAAGNAVIAALTPIKNLLTVGGIFFPSIDTGGAAAADNPCPMGCNVANPLHWIPGPGACCLNGVAGSCSVNTIDQPDEINFTTADAFITGLPMQWNIAGISETPLETAIQRAASAIAGRKFTDPLIVLVMTDGEPNCGTNGQNVLDQITKWHSAGINTHVVGLPGAQGAADVLNMMAAAGGTDKYIDPADPTELEMRLNSVISSTLKKGFDSCVFKLNPKPDAPEKLHMIVTENGMENDVPRDLSKDAHWSINADGDQVTLEGQLCDFAKDGTFDSLRFVYGCVTQPPLPPPPPIILN